MKRLVACLLIPCFAACSESTTQVGRDWPQGEQKTAEPEAVKLETTETATGPARSSNEVQQEPVVESPTALAEQLAKLTAQARQQEENQEFELAARTWDQIRRQLDERYGRDSWQAANAAAAGQVALAESRFSQHENRLLERAKNRQTEFNQLVQAQQLDLALPVADELYRLHSELFGEQSVMAGRKLLRFAEVQKNTGDHVSAISHFHQAITILKSGLVERHPEIEMAIGQLGQSYAKLGQYSPAVFNLKQATRLAAELWGDDSMEYARRANELGVVYHQAGQNEIALNVLQASEAIRRRKLGPEHPQVGHSLLNLGIVHTSLKNYPLAETCLTNARQIFAKDDAVVREGLALVDARLATLYMLTGRFSDAEPLLKKILESSIAQQKSDVEIASHRYKYAVCLCRQAKYQAAEPLLEEAIRAQQSALPPRDPALINSLKAYGMLLNRVGRKQEAETVQQQILRLGAATNQPPRR